NYILNVSVDDYSDFLFEKYRLDVPEICFDQVFADSMEKEIPGSRFPKYEFHITDPYKTIRREVIIYHLPYKGNINLLTYTPNPRTFVSSELEVDTRKKLILIEVINFYNDPERIKHG